MSDTLEDDALALAFDLAGDGPWDVNAYGLWCPACGWLALAPWQVKDAWVPEHCPECGHE